MPANSSDEKLSFLFWGVGAIGTYIGGSLALSGQKVVFLERPEIADRVCQQGLSLQIKGQQYHISNPQVAGSLTEALEHGPFDVAVLAIKSFDTRPLLETLSNYREQLPPFLCLQNGVENETALAEFLGVNRVIAGSVTSAVGRADAGSIVLERLRGVGIASNHPLSSSIHLAMNAAGLKAKLYPHPAGMKWSKMITNLQANASSAILDMPPGEIFGHSGLYHLEMLQLREALTVMKMNHFPITDLPGTPVKVFAFLVRYFPEFVSRMLLSRALSKGRGNKMPSFHIDLHSGRGKSEVDYLNGAVVRSSKTLGIPAPANDFLNQTLISMTEGTIDPAYYAHQPDKFLSDFMKR